jgi:predicted site-specific integrase-resolvase
MCDDGLIKAKELARQLRVTVATVNRWRLDGRIPVFTLGPRSHRYCLADVIEALQREEEKD